MSPGNRPATGVGCTGVAVPIHKKAGRDGTHWHFVNGPLRLVASAPIGLGLVNLLRDIALQTMVPSHSLFYHSANIPLFIASSSEWLCQSSPKIALRACFRLKELEQVTIEAVVLANIGLHSNLADISSTQKARCSGQPQSKKAWQHSASTYPVDLVPSCTAKATSRRRLHLAEDLRSKGATQASSFPRILACAAPGCAVGPCWGHLVRRVQPRKKWRGSSQPRALLWPISEPSWQKLRSFC